jgi:hypothetical protein
MPEWAATNMPKLPDISDEELARLQTFIKPLTKKGDELWSIHPVDARQHSYTWDPKPLEKMEDLVLVTSVKTSHTCGYYGFVKPSIAEVLCQLPRELTEGNEELWYVTLTSDAVIHKCGGGHRCTTAIYRRKPVAVTSDDITAWN